MLKKNLRILSAGIMSTAILATITPAIAFATPTHTEAPKTDRYIVSYTDNANAAETSANIDKKGGKVNKSFKHALKGATVDATPAQAADIKTVPGVKAVEVDQKIKVMDSQQSAPWGLDRSDQNNLPLNGTYNYDANAGKNVNIYIVDTGVLTGHSEFTGRLKSGWTVVSDGLGTSDCNGHGTHVAGIAAGTTYGIAKSANIIPVRVFGCDGSGYMSDVISGLDWVAADHAAGVAAVVNLSLGGAVSSATDTAVQKVIDDGVTVAVAAGNSTADACNSSPARVPGAITVAASDKTDTQTSFSNYGSCVDIYAPGDTILSSYNSSNTASAYMSGTSMASPHVAGAAAVLLSRNPALIPSQVASSLSSSATAGLIKNLTAGTPNKLLYLPATSASTAPAPVPAAKAPAAPTSISATAGTNAANLSWLKGSDNGSALTKQTINIYEGSTRVQSLDIGADYTSASITGLPAGKTYSFTVTESNTVGTSPESSKSNAITILGSTTPAAPTAVKAVAGYGNATVSWTKGSDGGAAITSQIVTVYSGTSVVKTVSVPAASVSTSISGLYNGTYYTFSVKAVNSIGTGSESVKSAQITPTAKVANAATSIKATANASAATISWIKGNDNGAALTSQIVTVYSGTIKIGTATIGGSYNSVQITGLTKGKPYTFTIKEVNKMGTSIESVKSNIVTPY